MDFKCITSQIKSQETLNKLHNENAWGSMLTRGIPTYNHQQKAHKIDVHFFLSLLQMCSPIFSFKGKMMEEWSLFQCWFKFFVDNLLPYFSQPKSHCVIAPKEMIPFFSNSFLIILSVTSYSWFLDPNDLYL